MEQEPMIEENKSNPNSWMIIFADLLALLLTFFVLMFSMSSVQVSEWQALVTSLSENLNPERAKIDDYDWNKIDEALILEETGMNLDYLKNVFEDKMSRNAILSRSTVTVLDDRLAISLPSDLIFELGQAELEPDARAAMIELGETLRTIDNEIMVVGHSDLSPISGRFYPTNWELSLVRAILISRLIKTGGYEGPIEAYGNGSSRFSELDESIPLDQRYNLARRVDVIVLQKKRN
ncbi:OmpA/MotB family protein [Pseudemcibacter aquimaris]|uniref:OmpA/MotB family protein n=1 Tax=Pseudemcibacter aquimaris TaxID=2857064 RepID=UPI002011E2E4|nr:flagellar motor protein MotB [Pseudemcibacter aquimaris]MCC3860820.1 OmpA family protein [Pseudemcibacter aquimaris]WDU59640.1 OmpA family protein [Pseudemcibacter aquimaris]